MTIDWARRKYSPERFSEVWNSSRNLTEVAIGLGLTPSGRSYESLRIAAESINLSSDHMTGTSSLGSSKNRKSLEEWLTYGSGIGSHKLKNKLWKAGIFKKECSICGITSWQGQEAPLCLDHKDGDNRNNVLSNLRILCLNCHGLTDTYAGKNIGRYRKNNRDRYTPYLTCPSCEGKMYRGSKTCSKCVKRDTAISWPSDEDLVRMTQKDTYVHVAKILGVSDTSVRKRVGKILS